MEVTLQDIAKELDVSATTVSRALRHDRTITPDTRARVNETARRLGYKTRARRPRRVVEHDPQSQTLGLLMRHRSLDGAQHDGNLMKMMAGIMSVMDEQGMRLQMYPWQVSARHADGEISLPLPLIQDGACQAVIAHGEHDENDLSFLSHRMPVVSMGRVYENLPIDAAVADNVRGVQKVVTHLVELGHRRLAWVGAPYTGATFMHEREAGFIAGCRKHGVELGQNTFFGPEIYKEHNLKDIHDKAALLAATKAGVTGFVCGNDAIAIEVIAALEEAGRRVPDEISVTGFDAWLGQNNTRRATSIDPNFLEIGKGAARLALQRIANLADGPRIISVRGNLVPGETTAPPPKASRAK